jgi:hypothetical protein
MGRPKYSFFLVLVSALLVIAPCDGGASAYTILDEVRSELDASGVILEIGSDRGEGSTSFLSMLANSTGRHFFSIDFSAEGYSNAQKICGMCAQQVYCVLSWKVR